MGNRWRGSGGGESTDRHAGGSADNFVATNMDLSTKFTAGANAQGAWRLKVVDNAAQDVGALSSWSLTINNGGNPGGNTFTGQSTTGGAIPDNNTTGISSTISATGVTSVTSVQVQLNITHSYRGDLKVTLTNPAGVTKVVIDPASNFLIVCALLALLLVQYAVVRNQGFAADPKQTNATESSDRAFCFGRHSNLPALPPCSLWHCIRSYRVFRLHTSQLALFKFFPRLFATTHIPPINTL